MSDEPFDRLAEILDYTMFVGTTQADGALQAVDAAFDLAVAVVGGQLRARDRKRAVAGSDLGPLQCLDQCRDGGKPGVSQSRIGRFGTVAKGNVETGTR